MTHLQRIVHSLVTQKTRQSLSQTKQSTPADKRYQFSWYQWNIDRSVEQLEEYIDTAIFKSQQMELL